MLIGFGSTSKMIHKKEDNKFRVLERGMSLWRASGFFFDQINLKISNCENLVIFGHLNLGSACEFEFSTNPSSVFIEYLVPKIRHTGIQYDFFPGRKFETFLSSPS